MLGFWVSHRRFGEFNVYYKPSAVGIYLQLPGGQAIASPVDRGVWDRHVRATGATRAARDLLRLYGSAMTIHSNPKFAQETYDAWDQWLRDHA